jgi:2-keto-3-deoxy-L-rhamnonate aldolase RhmA
MSSLKPNQLLASIRAGRVEHCFVFGNHATPRVVDYVASSGLFQTLWFDLEHFDIATDKLAVLNLVARAHPVTTLARCYATNYQTVQRILETGVGGMMCSMVESREEAAQIVRWAKFNNPLPADGETVGLRGWNGGGVDARYGTVPAKEYVAHQNRETVVLCQIETEAGMKNLDEIVSTPGVNGIFFGPGDYAHRIGRLGEIGHSDVLAAMQRVADSCTRHGKFWGTLGIGRDHYLKVKALGARLICPGGDVRTLSLGLRELAKTFQEPAP